MRSKKIRWEWLSAALISLLMFTAPAFAGDLNPNAPPGPTMKTLNEIPARDEVIPPWSQILPASERFKVLSYNTGEVQFPWGVLDRETGLVWERVPDSALHSWTGARGHCQSLEVDGRHGWRLPIVEETASLLDTTVSTPPYLSIGHPFIVQLDVSMELNRYWSNTSYADDPASAEANVINFGTGNRGSLPKSDTYKAWCVRGGRG